ncbi:putative quinol monooxygenase [Pseudodesulfovibrio senegalensis]|jgi:quinol monooxygenase YgiN|uniref:Antibiotic biosynthesis monooxygenase n=1 Tax=Pseudodesulfovibrio senegalensis TaxID=1721087 RepID=A0A6N6MXC8_9BACT|nr:putative quinol monooxygenase [Pseudodesulfovibrio senegalensis]KAB1438963.1 antibiotic biosynthesis monooxygenase [Pseudodesulfovibrio senegalensis]
METICVHVLFEARPGFGDRLAKVLLRLQDNSRKDSGCLQYDMHRLPDDPDQFMLYERWESQELLDAHLGAEHLAGVQKEMADVLVDKPLITIWNPLKGE